MINSLLDLLKFTEKLIEHLSNKIEFSNDGFPIFEDKMILQQKPDLIVPYYNRKNKIVKNPNKTVLCFYSADSILYRRLEKVFNDIIEYKKYMGVIGLDLTITRDMDDEWQNLIMLINQLFLAVLACNKIKIIPNARIGSQASINNLKSIPPNVIWATSFLGCENLKSESDLNFISKILYILPSEILIYGKHDKIAEKQLNNIGINYHTYTDFHRLTKEIN